MTPTPFDPVADARSLPRYFARAAMVAPFAALSVMWIARQLERRQEELVASTIDNLGSGISLSIVVLGLACGITGVIGGLRRGSRDTVMIAGLGLFIGGGYFLLTVWGIVFLSGQ